ncbi:MAG TPA: SDR family oxidoreductase [Candidatus Saccharimonadia bacterium]|nr:SDR family oxidoreductase [Candidatus Saccharimonadia bacterium]
MTKDNRKVALITGANKSIGFEVARQLGEQGIHVLIGARDEGRGKAAVEQLTSQNILATYLSLDVTDGTSIKKAAAQISKEFGKLDILVNNAGISGGNIRTPPSQTDIDVVRQVYETNVFGVTSVTIAMIPLLRLADQARIVNVSSSLGSLNMALDPNDMFYGINSLQYQSSKAALNAITIEFAKELEGEGIKVNAACPGFVDTDFNGHRGTKSAKQAATIIVKLSTLGADGPTASFRDEDGELPW